MVVVIVVVVFVIDLQQERVSQVGGGGYIHISSRHTTPRPLPPAPWPMELCMVLPFCSQPASFFLTNPVFDGNLFSD